MRFDEPDGGYTYVCTRQELANQPPVEVVAGPTPKHRCPLPPAADYADGVVVRCLVCRRRYRLDSIDGWLRRYWPWPR